MSDVGLTSDLTLDIRNALEQVARLEAALTAATSGIAVTAEAGAVTSEVTSAVDAADTEVEVTGEAGEVTGEVEGAIDAADSEVTVTGDADEIPGEVTSAIDAADTEATITGDASEVPGEIEGAISSADAEVEVIGDAGEIPGEIEGAVSSVDATVPIKGDTSQFVSEVNVAESATNDLERSVSFVEEAVHHLGPALGAAAFAAFIENAVEATENFNSQLEVTEQLIETTGATAKLTFKDLTGAAGEISGALGVTKGEVLKVQDILLTFKQVSGGTFKEATKLAFDMSRVLGSDATGAALQLGIALNDPIRGVTRLRRAGVQMTATQLAQIKAFVESGDILSAQKIILAEVTSQLGGTAEASAKMSDKISVAGKAIRGQFAQPIVEVVDDLGPRFIEALSQVGGGARATGQVLAEAFRAVLEVLIAVTPALGSTTALLSALTPIIQALAVAIDAIPDPLLQFAAAMFTLNRALSLGSGIFNVTALAMSKLLVPSTAITGAFNSAEGAATGLTGATGALGASTIVLGAALAVGALALLTWQNRMRRQKEVTAAQAKETEALAATLDDTTAVGDTYVTMLKKAAEAHQQLTVQVTSSGRSFKTNVTDVLHDAGLTVSEFTDQVEGTRTSFKDWVNQLRDSGQISDETALALVELREQMREAAKSTIESGTATEEWSKKQADAAEKAHTAADGTVNYGAALADLRSRSTESKQATEDQTQALADQKEALASLTSEAPLVAAFLDQLGDGNLTRGFINLAGAIDQAGLSEEQLGAIAEQLGVPIGVLKSNVDAVTKSMQDFTSGVEGSLPTIQENLQSLGDKVTFEGIRKEFQKTFEDMVNFEHNLALLAAFPNVQAAAAAAGPEVAAALAKGVTDGKTDSLAQMELLAIGTAQHQQDIIDATNNKYAPNFAAAQAKAGLGGTAAFAASFQLAGHTTAQGNAAVSIMRSKSAQLDQEATKGGKRAASGFRAGVSGMPGAAESAASRTRDAISRAGGYDAGFSVGSNVGRGFSAGVASWTRDAESKAAQLVIRAKAAASQAAKTGSPSKVFMEIGSDIGEGLAIGIEGQGTAVADAAAAIVSGAANAAGNAAVPAFDVTGAAAGSGNTFVTVGAGAVVVQLPVGSTAADQRRVLREASAAFWGTLADRKVAASARLR